MATEVTTNVTPSLHPDIIKNVDGYDDDTAGVLAQTEAAFKTAYDGLNSIYEARAAVFSDPRLNEAGALLKTDDFAGPVLDRITRAFDAETARLDAVHGVPPPVLQRGRGQPAPLPAVQGTEEGVQKATAPVKVTALRCAVWSSRAGA